MTEEVIKPKILIRPISRFDPETKREIERSPEEKQYLLLLYYIEDPDEKTFEIITGRSFAREWLMEQLGAIDVDSSYVLVEDVPFKDSLSNQITVRKFLNMVQKYYDDNFDINEYIDSVYEDARYNQDYDSNPTAEDLNDNRNVYYDPSEEVDQVDI